MTELQQLLVALGLDDVSAFVWGLLSGATLAALWVSGWFVGEAIVNKALEPGFNAHVDDALENSRERGVA